MKSYVSIWKGVIYVILKYKSTLLPNFKSTAPLIWVILDGRIIFCCTLSSKFWAHWTEWYLFFLNINDNPHKVVVVLGNFRGGYWFFLFAQLRKEFVFLELERACFLEKPTGYSFVQICFAYNRTSSYEDWRIKLRATLRNLYDLLAVNSKQDNVWGLGKIFFGWIASRFSFTKG